MYTDILFTRQIPEAQNLWKANDIITGYVHKVHTASTVLRMSVIHSDHVCKSLRLTEIDLIIAIMN